MSRPRKTGHAEVGVGSLGPLLDLDDHIETKVAVFANRLSRSASRFYRKRYGIGVVEWRLIMFMGRVSETRANRICSETDLDKGAVSRSLGVLQRKGIVSVRGDGVDGRRNNIALTPKGIALYDEMVPIALDRQSELVSGLTQVEIETFIKLICRLQVKVTDGEPMADEILLGLRAQGPRSLKPASRSKGSARRAPARKGARGAAPD